MGVYIFFFYETDEPDITLPEFESSVQVETSVQAI